MASKKNTQRPTASVRASVERRVFNLTSCEVREASGDGPAVFSGYAAVFNELSVNLGGFRERIQEGCFRNAVEEGQDVRFLINHDASLLLGRTKSGTVTLSEDEVGLRVECPLPETSYADDLVESMRRGDIDQMSFGFVTRSDAWKEKDKETGLPIRELLEADLFDVSVVTYPAYPDTTAEVRALIQEQTPELLERAQRAAEELDAQPEAEPEADETEEREVETTEDTTPDETTDLKAEYEQQRADAGVRIEEDHIQCDGIAVVWNFNDELQSCHLTREAAEAQVEALMSGAAGAARSDEDRAGKVLSTKNKETISEAIGLLSAVLDAAEPKDDDTIGEIVGLNDARPDMAAFRTLIEERGWSWDDDYSVWMLTQMIECASGFLVWADSDDDEMESNAVADSMKSVLASLTELLASVVADAARDADTEGEQRDDADEPDTVDEAEARFEKERRRLKLMELEASL